jgi:hypothetical protein
VIATVLPSNLFAMGLLLILSEFTAQERGSIRRLISIV